MTPERATVSQCIKVAAGNVCIWAVGLAAILGFSGLQAHHIESQLGTAILFGSLAAAAVGIPVFSNKNFRNLGSVFFLIASGVVVTVLLYALAAFGFFAYIMLNWNPSSGR